MRAIVAGVVVLSCQVLHGQELRMLNETRTPESERPIALWEAVTTVGPTLIHTKVVEQSWEGRMHCVHVVFDAPDIVDAVYEISHDGQTTTIGDFDVSLAARWMEEVAAILTDRDPPRPALSQQKFKHCVRVTHSALPAISVLVKAVETTDGLAFGDTDILKRRHDARRRFRESLRHLETIANDAAQFPGLVGCSRLRAHLQQSPADDPLPQSPPIRLVLRDLLDGVLEGHPDLDRTSENVIPQIQEVIQRYLRQLDGRLP
jgi:hypothetical protein